MATKMSINAGRYLQPSRAVKPASRTSSPISTLYSSPMRFAAVFGIALASVAPMPAVLAEPPVATVVEGRNVKVLTGILAPQFQEEMNLMVQALGVSCNTCHVRNNFASEDDKTKLIARR